MNPTQLDLQPLPAAFSDPNVEQLEALLLMIGEWLPRCEIERITGWGDRQIRELASASGWVLPGQKGYLHIKFASAEEIHHASAWLESQAKKMAERAGRLRSNAHKLFG
jgi:hypothetical protein